MKGKLSTMAALEVLPAALNLVVLLVLVLVTATTTFLAIRLAHAGTNMDGAETRELIVNRWVSQYG